VSFFGELKRRNVVKVAVAYAIVGWLLIEVSTTVLPLFEAPDWIAQVFAFFVILGFPLALILSWAYELTPEGLKLERDVTAGESITPVTGRKIDFAIIGALVLALGFVVFDNYVFENDAALDSSIAVLPFGNLSPDAENAFFADGIHGELLTQLSKIGALRVISRTSVMEYRDSPKNIREIGRELNVSTILEGDVRRAGDTVRINVQLIDAETDEHLWANIYDRELTARNILAIQSEMATAIAEALHATFSPQEVARLNEVPTQNTRAYDFYLSGREFGRRGVDRGTDIPLAVQQYERAVEEDREFALAWAHLAVQHIRMYWFAIDRTDERRRTALSAVERALDLQPDLPEAHLAMAWYHYHAYRNYEEALRELAIAEQGMPGDSEPLFLRAAIYRRQGQWEQAVTSFDRAIELDPRNVDLLLNHGATYRALRDYAQAERSWDRALDITPNAVDLYLAKAQIPLWRDGDVSLLKAAAENPPFNLGDQRQWLGWTAAIYERDYDTALSYLEEWEIDVYETQVQYVPTASFYGVTYQLAGQPELAQRHFRIARAQVEDALQAAPDDPRLLISLGEILAGLGEAESAVPFAEEAIKLMPTSLDAVAGPNRQLNAIIRVFIPAAAVDTAIEELDTYLAGPGGRWSIEGFLPDPRLDFIRDDPRFQALVEKYRRQ